MLYLVQVLQILFAFLWFNCINMCNYATLLFCVTTSYAYTIAISLPLDNLEEEFENLCIFPPSCMPSKMSTLDHSLPSPGPLFHQYVYVLWSRVHYVYLLYNSKMQLQIRNNLFTKLTNTLDVE